MTYKVQRQLMLIANRRRRKKQIETLEKRVERTRGTSEIYWNLTSLMISAGDRQPACRPRPYCTCLTHKP
jgi:hypothetical protein